MSHLAVFDVAARLQHLEPADLPERARGAADGILDRVFDAVLRGTGDLDDPVDVIVGPSGWSYSPKRRRADFLPPGRAKTAVYTTG